MTKIRFKKNKILEVLAGLILILSAVAMMNPYFLILAFPVYLLGVIIMCLTKKSMTEKVQWIFYPLGVIVVFYLFIFILMDQR